MVISAGIRKNVTPHSLRRSYVTHLIESGVNLRYVQELLGHSRVETTQIYTHVAHQEMAGVKSPFDNLFRNNDQWAKELEDIKVPANNFIRGKLPG